MPWSWMLSVICSSVVYRNPDQAVFMTELNGIGKQVDQYVSKGDESRVTISPPLNVYSILCLLFASTFISGKY